MCALDAVTTRRSDSDYLCPGWPHRGYLTTTLTHHRLNLTFARHQAIQGAESVEGIARQSLPSRAIPCAVEHSHTPETGLQSLPGAGRVPVIHRGALPPVLRRQAYTPASTNPGAQPPSATKGTHQYLAATPEGSRSTATTPRVPPINGIQDPVAGVVRRRINVIQLRTASQALIAPSASDPIRASKVTISSDWQDQFPWQAI